MGTPKDFNGLYIKIREAQTGKDTSVERKD
jgi:hypothetical protein